MAEEEVVCCVKGSRNGCRITYRQRDGKADLKDHPQNSEVGHNAFGAGSVPKQRATLTKEAIETKSLFKSQKWLDFSNGIKNKNKKLHFIGVLSNGYVHSHFSHLIGLLIATKNSGIKMVRIHPLLDGRDVPPQSSLKYIRELEMELRSLLIDKKS